LVDKCDNEEYIVRTTTTIRVSEKTRDTLHALARDVGVPMAEVVELAIEQYRRQRILDAANAEYAALRADPEAWAEVQAERAVWDVTLADGLEEREGAFN
jgi:predicted DNA-binding protein